MLNTWQAKRCPVLSCQRTIVVPPGEEPPDYSDEDGQERWRVGNCERIGIAVWSVELEGTRPDAEPPTFGESLVSAPPNYPDVHGLRFVEESGVERLRTELARLAGWFMVGYEPKAGELRTSLVQAGINGPDELSALLHPTEEAKK